jgi:hypothetical protein
VDPVHIYGNGSQKIQIGYPLVDSYTAGLWHFDETGGTDAYLKDYSGNSRDATPSGTTLVDGFSG